MEHDDLRSKLYEFYDGELAPEEARIFSEHLAACPECRAEIEALRNAAQIFFRKPQLAVPAAFSERVLDRIGERSWSAQKTGWISIFDFLNLPRWEVATALSISLLVISYFTLDYAQSRAGTDENPISLMADEMGAGQWFFSKDVIDKEDLLQMTIGNEIG